jgi:hypothetical protein
MLASTAHLDLYPRILGESWDSLPEAVRSAHQLDSKKTGRFRVTHGQDFLTRRLARMAKLPSHTESANVVLKIRSTGSGEVWERRFDAHEFTTVQWNSNGLLVERFGSWELQFALQIRGGALIYEQCGARLCLGPLSLPVPMAFAPRVSAREEASGTSRVRVFVTVSLPILGPLITYEGYLDVGDLEP